MITLTIPNDDHIALRAFGKALEEMALAHGAEPRKTVGELSYKLNIDTTEATAALERLRTTAEEFQPEIDTTAQQVESLAVPMDDNEERVPPTTDSTGTPWDERIHSTSKALNADGTWRLRRKPTDKTPEEWAEYVKWVEEDIYTVQHGQTEEPPEIGEPTREEVDELIEASNKMLEPPVTPPGDDFHTDADVVSEQTVAGIPPLPVPQLGGSSSHSSQSTPYKLVGSGDDLSSGSGTCIPPLPVPPPVVVAPPVTEWDFPRLMTFLTERHGKIDVATVNTLLAQDGMSSVQELNAHPDKIGPFVARVKAHLGE